VRDVYKYVAINPSGDVFIAVNSHPEDYSDFIEVYYSREILYSNQTLRIYKTDITLLPETWILIAENILDFGTTTMKATDRHLIVASGQKPQFKPRFEVINLLPDANGVKKYDLQHYLLDDDVKEIIDII